MVNAIVSSFISFIGTNIDDILVLMILFAQVEKRSQKRDIIVGRIIGTFLLVGLSILAACGLSFVPTKYVKFLGIIPIILGIKTWYDYKKDEVEALENAPIKKTGSMVVSTIALCFANGADNIGVYIPLFSRFTIMQMGVSLMVFLIMSFIWCLFAQKLSDLHMIKIFIQKYKHIIVPLVYIGLGVLILIK